MDDGYEFAILIGLIFLSAGLGSYYESGALGCIVFGGGVVITALFSGMINYLNNKS